MKPESQQEKWEEEWGEVVEKMFQAEGHSLNFDEDAVKSFIRSLLTKKEQEVLERVKKCFRETEKAQWPDEIHCSCLAYCEWVIDGKPEPDLRDRITKSK